MHNAPIVVALRGDDRVRDGVAVAGTSRLGQQGKHPKGQASQPVHAHHVSQGPDLARRTADGTLTVPIVG
jgi:hypothetical protein